MEVVVYEKDRPVIVIRAKEDELNNQLSGQIEASETRLILTS
jgi:hypothetical protein